MDFKDSIKQVAERVQTLKDNLQTEEATKNALIMPFITALGYDVFNPLEVVPEMTCDIGTKKGEKIDYAILKDGEPVMLIECKHWKEDLGQHDNQLLRYFGVSKAKFGILTNGITYKFYSDLETPNVMDSKPFLEVDLSDLRDGQIEELKKFHKSYFDIDTILSTASELKYMGELKAVIAKEFSAPSADLVKLWGKQVYQGLFTAKVSDQFSTLIKKAIGNYINDIISDRLNAAIKDVEHNDNKEEAPAIELETKDDNGIVTTDEEKEAHLIIKAILRDTISPDRVNLRDAKSYCTIIADDNNRKLICRLYFNNPKNKKIAIWHKDIDAWENFPVETLDSIYQYSDKLIKSEEEYK